MEAAQAGAEQVSYRQQIMILHSASTDLCDRTVGWALYDGAAPWDAPQMRTGDEADPPYPSVLAAMRDGWRVLQVPEPRHVPGWEHETAELPFGFVLAREVLARG